MQTSELLSPEIKEELSLDQRLEKAELSKTARKKGRKLLDYYEQLKEERDGLEDKRKIRDNLKKQKETLEKILEILEAKRKSVEELKESWDWEEGEKMILDEAQIFENFLPKLHY